MNKHTIQLITVFAVIASAGGLELQARHDDAPTGLLAAAPAEPPYVPAGFYVGTCTSPAMARGSIPFAAEVVQVQGKHQARLICSQPDEYRYEDWTWDDSSLSVTRHVLRPGNRMPDGRMREEVSQLKGYMTGGRYSVLCPDPAGIDCGMGLPAGSSLTITTSGDGFRCEVWQPKSPNQPGRMALLQAFAFDRAQ